MKPLETVRLGHAYLWSAASVMPAKDDHHALAYDVFGLPLTITATIHRDAISSPSWYFKVHSRSSFQSVDDYDSKEAAFDGLRDWLRRN